MSGSRPRPAARIRAVQSAIAAAVVAIAGHPSRQEALTFAAELRQILGAAESEAASLRARAAHDIWTTERVTLAELADSIGVSKARASQIVTAGRRDTEIRPRARNRRPQPEPEIEQEKTA